MKKRCNGCFNHFDDEFELCPHCGYIDGSEPKEPNHLFVGTELAGRYIVGNVLGFGGFGITYKAWDKKLDTVVAIKEYYPSGIVNRPPGTKNILLFSGKKKKEFEYGLTRFIEEARNMTNFNSHRNIVNVYEYFEENSTAYIVMEFLDGCNLSEFIESANGKLDIETSMKIILNTCNALKDIHANGIIHRDVSPDNIFLTKNGGIKLIDFGAARFSNNEDKNFTIILKPGFAPPEQYDQISQQGPKTDIYALGATLYYCITGEKPEESTNRKIKDNLISPKQIDSSIEQYLSDSIMKAMAIEPALRFESITEFEKAVKKEIKVKAPNVEKKRRKTKRLIGVAVLVMLLSVVAGVFIKDVDEKQTEVTLNPATINVYYVEAGNKEIANEQETAYKKIEQDFEAAYKDVEVKISGYSRDEYAKVMDNIKEGKTDVNLFVSDGMSDADLSFTLNLHSVIYDEEASFLEKLFGNMGNKTGCSVLDDYDKYYPEGKQVPIGFNVPIVYVNRKNETYDEENHVDIDDKMLEEYINQGYDILVKEGMYDLYNNLFEMNSPKIKQGSVDSFIGEEYKIYFSDSSEYFHINNEILMLEVLGVDENKLKCTFSTHWSIMPSEDDDENRAAKAFLSYLLSQDVQRDIYKVSEALPINDEALKNFGEVFDKWEFIYKRMNDFSF